ncbi:hypothetical protein QUF49_13705 [Fictibacillus sp. b24]|uniref:hypothetical protein n=1 Tax=unclassified Fictibacillus TaxID=2644029 RepID=UPI0025A23E5C|nr:hypothetical protein [Fictibacillus sp. b24]MDM5317057.1 hypothetical protein [Fictibacillus sp. b24]
MRWVTGILFSVLGVLLLTQGLHLRSMSLEEVDGNGIGVYFLGMEINEKVATADIQSYANGFLGTGTIFLLLAVCLFVILLKEKSTLKPIHRKNPA